MTRSTAGVSPKLTAATVAAVAAYLLGETVLALPAWAVVACQAVLVAAAAYTAPPGHVVTTRKEHHQ
jgi:hypothetical protein